MNKSAKITRKNLYDQVWAEPITKLSQRYGLSDVGLAKICKRNNIPRPPRGYWARVQSGQRVAKTPLPKGDDDRIIEINGYTSHNLTPKETGPFIKKALPQRLPNKIVVPESLTDPHPLVMRSAEILESRRPDTTGIVSPPKRGCLNISVSQTMMPKALLIIDTVIKSLQSMGHNVSITGGETAAKILDMVVYIGISEELVHRRVKAKDHNLDGYYQFGYKLFEKKFTPTGNLLLEIIDQRYPWRREMKRQKWRDTGSTPLEHLMKRFVTALIKAAALRKAALQREQQASAENAETGNE